MRAAMASSLSGRLCLIWVLLSACDARGSRHEEGSAPSAHPGTPPTDAALAVKDDPAREPGGPVEDAAEPAWVERDSAGIRIVMNRVAGDRESWTVDPLPALQIGAVDGEDAYVFGRLESAALLADGRIVVVEGSARQIRIFSPHGRHERSFGGPGGGPGEFVGVPVLKVLPGDTLLAWDRSGGRYTWFLADGTVVRDARYEHDAERATLGVRPPTSTTLLTDGTLFFGQEVVDMDRLERRSAEQGGGGVSPHPENEFVDRVTQIALVFPGGRTGINLGRAFPFGRTISSGGTLVTSFAHPRAAFTAESMPVRVHSSVPPFWEVRTVGADGTLRRIVRLELPRRPVTARMIEAEHRRALEYAGNPQEASRLFRGFRFPDSLFPIDRLEVDRSGNLWVREHRSRDEGRATTERYIVLDSAGRWVATAEVPADAGMILEFGPDQLLTIWRDELRVPYVRLYRVRRD
jgi:hypothetical protein